MPLLVALRRGQSPQSIPMKALKSALAIAAAVLVVAVTVPTFADDKGERAKDEESIKQVAKAWQKAWNQHDAVALAALVIEDVDFVRNNTGWLKGREQFQDFHAAAHERYFKDSEWT